ncbi:hypothetical protein [Deinococcus navajonensis]|uniref:Uncharacterized protein n=1 Tax=Deinococcus navajonensis TaxID=309884 RepID=A0ABV8XIE2_9DEIO
MKRLTLPLLALMLSTAAGADHTLTNLKDFRSVCVNTFVEIKGKEDENLRQEIYESIVEQLEDAGITVAQSPCQSKSGAASRQLNLLFSFSTTPNALAYLGTLEGWIPKEGKFLEPTIWTDHYYGITGKDKLSTLSADSASEMVDSFIEDWDEAH